MRIPKASERGIGFEGAPAGAPSSRNVPRMPSLFEGLAQPAAELSAEAGDALIRRRNEEVRARGLEYAYEWEKASAQPIAELRANPSLIGEEFANKTREIYEQQFEALESGEGRDRAALDYARLIVTDRMGRYGIQALDEGHARTRGAARAQVENNLTILLDRYVRAAPEDREEILSEGMALLGDNREHYSAEQFQARQQALMETAAMNAFMADVRIDPVAAMKMADHGLYPFDKERQTWAMEQARRIIDYRETQAKTEAREYEANQIETAQAGFTQRWMDFVMNAGEATPEDILLFMGDVQRAHGDGLLSDSFARSMIAQGQADLERRTMAEAAIRQGLGQYNSGLGVDNKIVDHVYERVTGDLPDDRDDMDILIRFGTQAQNLPTSVKHIVDGAMGDRSGAGAAFASELIGGIYEINPVAARKILPDSDALLTLLDFRKRLKAAGAGADPGSIWEGIIRDRETDDPARAERLRRIANQPEFKEANDKHIEDNFWRAYAESMGPNAPWVSSGPEIHPEMLDYYNEEVKRLYFSNRDTSLETIRDTAAANIFEKEGWTITKIGGGERWMRHAPERYLGAAKPGDYEKFAETQIQSMARGQITNWFLGDENYRLIPVPESLGRGMPDYYIEYRRPDGRYDIMLDERGTMAQQALLRGEDWEQWISPKKKRREADAMRRRQSLSAGAQLAIETLTESGAAGGFIGGEFVPGSARQ